MPSKNGSNKTRHNGAVRGGAARTADNATDKQHHQSITSITPEVVLPTAKKHYPMPAGLKHSKPTIRKPYQILDIDSEECWLRLRNEGGKAYVAFCAYRDMSSDSRSLQAVASKLGKSKTLIDRWSSMWAWPERVLAWDRQQERLLLAADAKSKAKEIAEMNKRQASLGLAMQAKSAATMQLLQPKDLNAHHAARLGRDGTWIERIARGAPTDVRETTIEGEVDLVHKGAVLHAHVDLSRLTDNELREYYRLTEKASVDSTEPGPVEG